MIFAVLLLGLNNVFFASQTVQLNVCSTPTQPVITAPADQSNTYDPTTLVTGTADPNSSISVVDNNQAAASVNTDASGDFAVSVSLATGANQLVATVKNACGDTADSAPITVERLVTSSPTTQPLPLSPIFSGSGSQSGVGAAGGETVVPSGTETPSAEPLILTFSNVPAAAYTSAGEATSEDTVLISGSATPNSMINITDNGRIVAQLQAGSDGQFSVQIPLTIGRNELHISVTNGRSTVSKTLIYVRTVPQPSAPWYKSKPVQVAGIGILTLLLVVVVRPRWLRIGKNR